MIDRTVCRDGEKDNVLRASARLPGRAGGRADGLSGGRTGQRVQVLRADGRSARPIIPNRRQWSVSSTAAALLLRQIKTKTFPRPHTKLVVVANTHLPNRK